MITSAGYYLINGSHTICNTRPLLPKVFYSLSSCISDIYPGAWGHSWVKITPKDKEEIQKLHISDSDFENLRTWVDEKFVSGEIGFPNVFISSQVARIFYNAFIKNTNLKNIKLLGIGLHEGDAAEYLNEYSTYYEKYQELGKSGIYLNLSKKEPIEQAGNFLGYEILGDSNNSFCSFACNGLEVDYAETLKIKLNKFGLIDSYADALRAVEFTIIDETGAEPVFWLPWAVYEYDL